MTKTQKRWKKRVAEWRRSGETSVQFCEGKDFSPSGLRHWAWRLDRLDGPAATAQGATISKHVRHPRLARVVTKPSLEAHAPLMPPDETPTHLSCPELVVEIGAVRIGVSRGFDTATLASVLDVLEARGGTR